MTSVSPTGPAQTLPLSPCPLHTTSTHSDPETSQPAAGAGERLRAQGSSAPASATCPYRSFWASVCPCTVPVPSGSPAELCAVTDLRFRHSLLGRLLPGQDPMSCEPQLVSISEEKLSSENWQFYFLKQQSAVQGFSSHSPH